MPKSIFIDPAEVRKKGKIKFEDIPMNIYDKTIEQEKSNYSTEDFLRIYRDITILREFETAIASIKTQGRYADVEYTYPGPAHLSLGQEASAVGQAYILDENDYTFGSHRSHSEILAKSLSCIWKLDDKTLLGIMEHYSDGDILRAVEGKQKSGSVKELAMDFIIYGAMAEIFARKNGLQHGLGGSMHAFFLPFGVYPNNAIVGGSAPISVGSALFKKCNDRPGIVVCNIGDGSLGCGPVWESLNFAAMDQFKTLWEEERRSGMPILFNIFNNGYGMGGQTVGETMAYQQVARVGSGITPTQMHAERVDGYNPLAVIEAMKRKKELLLTGEGPVLLDVITYRMTGHSVSDSNAYRSREEMEAWNEADPTITFRKALVDAGIAPDSDFGDIWADTRERMEKLCKLATDPVASPFIDFAKEPDFVERMMFSNNRVEKMSDETSRMLVPKEECVRLKQIGKKERAAVVGGKSVSKLKMYNLRDALSEAIINKYYEDPTLICYGEDVADWGGAYAVTRDFLNFIPRSRIFNSPISEAAIVGTAVGYGLSGGRVIAELMYADFMGRAGDEIFNQLSKWQAMSAGILKMPVTIRVSIGSKYGAQHSQDWIALPAHIPGLKVCFPATPYEAKGLMNSALNGTDPVMFFESQRLYDMGEQFHENGVPEEYYEIEFGDVNKVRTGTDLTILTIGATLYKAVEAAKELEEKYGVSTEIINLHSLVPLNYEKILKSVRKTGKVLLASDACARGSFLNDVAANITGLAFDDLDAPPVVVGAKNWITPPYEYDETFFPQKSWILDAVNEYILPLPGYMPTQNFTDVEQMRKAKLGV